MECFPSWCATGEGNVSSPRRPRISIWPGLVATVPLTAQGESKEDGTPSVFWKLVRNDF